MSISLSLGVGITSLRGILNSIRVSIDGLTNGIAEIGDHASLSAVMSNAGIISAYKWGSTAGGTEYGTGAAPTDYTAGDEGRLYLTVTSEGEDYTTSASILYPAPVAGSLAAVNETQGIGTIIVDLTAGFSAGPGVYTSSEAWLTVNGTNGEIDQDQVLSSSVDITKTISGRSATVTLSVTITENIYTVWAYTGTVIANIPDDEGWVFTGTVITNIPEAA